MFIFKSNQRRANPYAPFEAEDGTRYPRIPAELLEEIPDPQPPEDYSDETYYRTEQDEAPYVIFTKKSDEQLAQIAQAKLNQASLAYLAETDWMVLRAQEDPTKPVPLEVAAKRQAAREVIVRLAP